MTLMLWAVPTSPTRRMRRRGAPASDSLISGPRRRAPCPPPGTVASVPSCCARNDSASGPNSSLSYVITDYRWEVVQLSKSPDTKLIIVRLSSWRHRWTSVRHVFVVFPALLAFSLRRFQHTPMPLLLAELTAEGDDSDWLFSSGWSVHIKRNRCEDK